LFTTAGAGFAHLNHSGRGFFLRMLWHGSFCITPNGFHGQTLPWLYGNIAVPVRLRCGKLGKMTSLQRETKFSLITKP